MALETNAMFSSPSIAAKIHQKPVLNSSIYMQEKDMNDIILVSIRAKWIKKENFEPSTINEKCSSISTKPLFLVDSYSGFNISADALVLEHIQHKFISEFE